jgi:hypothetical protein
MRVVGAGTAILSFLLGTAAVAVAKDKEEAPEAKPKVEVVKLGFAWPQALGADVTYRWTRTSTGKPAQGVTVVGKMNVATEGEATRVEYRDWQAEPSKAAATDAPPNYLQNAAPVVDKKGALVRVDGPAPALLKAGTVHAWQVLVQIWIGHELQVGKEYEVTNEGPVPVIPGGKMKRTIRFRAERLLDCPGTPGVRCVELKFHNQADRHSLARLTAALLAQSGKKVDASLTDALGGIEEATLVTEPGSLIPHRLTITKTLDFRPTKDEPDGRSQVDRTTWTYDYPAAGGAPPK